ncbi:MAG TPA: autotransporter outer membrane beta-barrel domain-containing protein [Devosia sp.]|uniref:autotransporter family protein n=1 Tax=Devosia sp. TaxID=1871048 RepID=UPI002DDDB7F2|nr:autotransporter outer membrane beta-barrel domain-containing protein [Devosia sp.]HEV2514239.1 autotransporter outer membrane beta-barrel domain-containing protein [Devosia sp.]
MRSGVAAGIQTGSDPVGRRGQTRIAAGHARLATTEPWLQLSQLPLTAAVLAAALIASAVQPAAAQFYDQVVDVPPDGPFTVGYHDFTGSTLNAGIADAVADGDPFTTFPQLWFFRLYELDVDGTVTGIPGAVTSIRESELNATVAAAVSGGSVVLNDSSQLNAWAPGAVSGGTIYFNGAPYSTVGDPDAGQIVTVIENHPSVQVLAEGALTNGVAIEFDYFGYGVPIGLLQMNGFDTTVGKINGLGTIQNGGADAAVLTVDSSVLGDSNFFGIIQDTDPLDLASGTGALGLTKTGAGTLVLSALSGPGTNTYTGPTIVDGGTLMGGADNAFSQFSATTVNTDGTLDLGGFAQAIDDVVLAGGTIRNGALNSLNGVMSTGGIIDGVGGTIGLTTTGGITTVFGINTYSGLTTVNGGTLTVADLASIASDTIVNAGGRLNGTGSVGSTTLNPGGIIGPGNNAIGILTVNGDFTSNGGTLEIEAELGGDGFPADLLLINGNSLLGLAPTLVQVINVGGLGGPATNGTKIIDVAGGTSDAGAFVLDGPAIGGAYSYQLVQDNLDWYLRNSGELAPTTPTFENYPVALLGMIDLPTLRQRVGDRTDAAEGIWTRIEGGAGHYEASGSSTGASYDGSYFLTQIGLEGTLQQSSEGSLTAGLTAQYSRHTADVASSFGDGSNLTESLGFGASLTWRGAEGTYLDLQGQLASFASDLEAVGYTLVEDNAGDGLAVSLETGHKFDLDDSWSLTPQAQLSYASVDFEHFTDYFGSEISLGKGDSLVGRFGVAIDYATAGVYEDGRASSSKLYGIANVTYEFLDGATVVVSGTDLNYSGQKFGAELGVGGALEWADGAQALHGELIGSSSLEGSYALKGTLGFTGRF